MKGTMLFVCIVAALVSPLAAAQQQCYFPNGDVDSHGKICNPTTVSNGGHSSCCYKGDICHEDGTCATKIWNDNYRQSCTDASWENPACPRDICLGNSTAHPEFPQRGISIIKCLPADRQACCKGSEDTCCDMGELFTYRPGQIMTILDDAGEPMYFQGSNITSSESTLKSEVIGLGVALGMVFLTGSGTIAFLWWRLHKEWERRIRLEERKTTSVADADYHSPPPGKTSRRSSSQVSAMSISSTSSRRPSCTRTHSTEGGGRRSHATTAATATATTKPRRRTKKEHGSDNNASRFNSVSSPSLPSVVPPSAELRYPPSATYNTNTNTMSSMHTQYQYQQQPEQQQYSHYQYYQPHMQAPQQPQEPQAYVKPQTQQNLPQQLGYYASGQDANELVTTERATELGADERAMELEIRPERFSFSHTPC